MTTISKSKNKLATPPAYEAWQEKINQEDIDVLLTARQVHENLF